MQDEYFSLMQRIAPDLAEQIERRALVLERIGALQPVGRRLLASRLNLPEREVRTVATLLREQGLVELDAAGMTLTPEADAILPAARRFSRDLRGLTKLETALSKLLDVPKVYVAAGDYDEDPHVLSEVGRIAAGRLRAFLQSGATLAVTGGQTIHEVAQALTPGAAMNVMVVPARGGIGRAVIDDHGVLFIVVADHHIQQPIARYIPHIEAIGSIIVGAAQSVPRKARWIATAIIDIYRVLAIRLE